MAGRLGYRPMGLAEDAEDAAEASGEADPLRSPAECGTPRRRVTRRQAACSKVAAGVVGVLALAALCAGLQLQAGRAGRRDGPIASGNLQASSELDEAAASQDEPFHPTGEGFDTGGDTPSEAATGPEPGTLHPVDGEDLEDWTLTPALTWDEAQDKARRAVESLGRAEKFSLLRGTGVSAQGYYVGQTLPLKSLGLPALKMQDAGSGFRPTDPGEAGTTTQWPSMLAMASTWDEALTGEVAGAIGREFRGKGANMLLGPGVNVHRVARGGRNFEYLSGEDPYLGARMARAYVEAVQSEGVIAVAKHFAFNEQETSRLTESSEVDVRTAWELYYPPFEAAIQAGVGAFMCSYNRVNGTPACGSSELLMRDLRGTMGFRGFVMSDWEATKSTASLEAGLDMELPEAKFFSDSKLQKVDESAVDEAVTRILTAMYRMRLDEEPGCEPPCYAEHASNQRTEAHVSLCRTAATRAVVLLKNDGVLPLDSSAVSRLAVIGDSAGAEDHSDMWQGSPYAGGGSGHVTAPRAVSPLAGIKARAANAGIEVSSYVGMDKQKAGEAAMQADVAVVVVSAIASEALDRADLKLEAGADELISAVAKVNRQTVVLMMTPGAVVVPWAKDVSAVANLFYGGEQTGAAWAAVLFGDESPSAKLPIVFPESAGSAIEPSMGQDVVYDEGLFSSYRSPESRATFPFGHGLSYTTFEYNEPRIVDDCDGAVCIKLSVVNNGAVQGAEVAQAYVRFSACDREPGLVLRGFQRTKSLSPSEAVEVLFKFTDRDLSVYHAESGWTRMGVFEVHIGASSSDIRRVVNVDPPGGAETSAQ